TLWGRPRRSQDGFGELLRPALQPSLVQQRLPPRAPLPAAGPLDLPSGGQAVAAGRIPTPCRRRCPLVQLRSPREQTGREGETRFPARRVMGSRAMVPDPVRRVAFAGRPPGTTGWRA